MSMSVVTCLYVYTCMQVSTKATRGYKLPGTASGSCELPDVGTGETNHGPLQSTVLLSSPSVIILIHYSPEMVAACSHTRTLTSRLQSHTLVEQWNLSGREVMESTMTFLPISMLLTCSSEILCIFLQSAGIKGMCHHAWP